MHPDFRKKPKPLFEGSTNPVTGEVGGPKTEPLQHGLFHTLLILLVVLEYDD